MGVEEASVMPRFPATQRAHSEEEFEVAEGVVEPSEQAVQAVEPGVGE